MNVDGLANAFGIIFWCGIIYWFYRKIKRNWEQANPGVPMFRIGDDCVTDYDAGLARRIGRETAASLAEHSKSGAGHEN